MLSKKEVLGMMESFDVKDLNQMFEMLQGLKSVRATGNDVSWTEMCKPIYKALDESRGHNKGLNSDSIEMCMFVYLKSEQTSNIIKDVQEIMKGVESLPELIKLEDLEIKEGRANLKIRMNMTKEQMNELSKKGVIL